MLQVTGIFSFLSFETMPWEIFGKHIVPGVMEELPGRAGQDPFPGCLITFLQ